jgi:hypothetical protein
MLADLRSAACDAFEHSRARPRVQGLALLRRQGRRIVRKALDRGGDRGGLLGAGHGSHSGMFPCLRWGPGSRFDASVCSAAISRGRVSWGTITSSM